MDEAKLHAFMGQLVTDMGGAAMIANVILGEELGLYRAMADSTPITPEALATGKSKHDRGCGCPAPPRNRAAARIVI